MQVDPRLFEIFDKNEPELVLLAYRADGEAEFQVVDEDKFRIGKMICQDVRVLCIATQYQSYSRLIVYNRQSLPSNLAWMLGVFDRNEEGCFAIMPAKVRGHSTHY